jgi:hypothetical protein
LHVAGHAIVAGDLRQGVTHGLTIDLTGILQGLPEQSERVVRQGSYVVGCLTELSLVGVNEFSSDGGGGIRGVVRAEILPIAIRAAQGEQL